METQSGARTPLVDPFGRELEEWLRDAPATRAPYVPDLVVPPVTGPVQRPGHAASSTSTADEAVVDPTTAPAHVATSTPADETAPADEISPSAPAAPAFRRDRARHAAVCAPSFPEPPERLALRIEDLAVEVSSSTGRSSIERIVLLEDEVRRRDEDLARLAAWEATVAGSEDPEVTAARAFAHTVFADLLTDAAAEADRRDRAAARRAATAPVALVTRPAPVPTRAAPSVPAAAQAAPTAEAAPVVALVTPERDELVRPVLGLPAVSPVSAATRPTPLVLPATGPTVIDRAAFAAALTAHQGVTASTPVVLPDAVAAPVVPAAVVDATEADTDSATAAAPAPAGWWSRLVDRLLGLLGRR
ncbi:hypothetical protein BIV02_08000 [Curtobacterium sp. MMLR14_014]|uniref:hypothetical protein n=1 Tax=unclassified Curtobacterium TaxID=257496 RepID=UPI0008F92DEC|nr:MULTISPECIES: hypothetical protein [unclassified Curtobacterium]OII40614.1 hypothetical protein BIU91_02020 [Curtobacterium sp. MMLR14_002]OII41968.1 hypothetical protein BIV02_08000 [Curtobacterium sp. MMLR14_014]